MEFRFEFDPVNRILLGQAAGRLTDESLAEIQQVARKYWVATDPSAGIEDLSSVTEFALSAQFMREVAGQEHPFNRPRVIVAPTTVGFGLFRMFQTVRDQEWPLITVVHTMDEAFATLGVQSPRFEPLE